MTRFIIILAAMFFSLYVWGGNPATDKKGTKTAVKEVYVIQHGGKQLPISNAEMKQLKPTEISEISVRNDTIFLSVLEKVFSDIEKKKRK
ncbi:MAG: hypothetical protein NC248_06980 [Bacteroides sp.]|nr:hypothetical protein [Bacteroides sp.]MCM1390543.1 hypothetical protein [Bacteroides sp.]